MIGLLPSFNHLLKDSSKFIKDLQQSGSMQHARNIHTNKTKITALKRKQRDNGGNPQFQENIITHIAEYIITVMETK